MIFAKGHGTQNDFVVLADLDAALALTPEAVSALCDRRRGLGADGVLRVTTAGAALAAGVFDRMPDGVSPDDWYMDYRNADGSIAQMCGNGVRVFAHYLRAGGLETRDEFVVGSLAGPRPVVMHHVDATYADVRRRHGQGQPTGARPGRCRRPNLQRLGGRRRQPTPGLRRLRRSRSRRWRSWTSRRRSVSITTQFPDGVNVEMLTAPVDGVVSMRVHERGVGETRSCGTGTVAAAVAALSQSGAASGTLTVRVPGGDVVVTVTEATSYLRGPSVLVAHGELSEQWWQEASR